MGDRASLAARPSPYPLPQAGEGFERDADRPLLPLAGEGWDEGASARTLYPACAVKVSQLLIWPLSKPRLNHETRCAELPWVKLSGTT